MVSFSFYLLKVIICTGVLFGYYWFFLRNKIFHSYNRFYLLLIVVLSLSLPLLKINIWHKADEPRTGVIKLLQVVNSSDEYMDKVIIYNHYNNISKEQVFSVLYFAICTVFLFLMLQVLFKIRNLVRKSPATTIEHIHFIRTNAKGTPFSFLKFIFWNDAIDMETRAGRQVFKHEVAHVQEKHSYDKLFINTILIFFWCNPFFWLIRKELDMIHEFIADKKAVEDGDTADFAAMILQATYPQYRFPLTNNFFYSPIKRRLLMLTKEHKTKVNYISRLLVLPLAVIVFAAFTIKARTYSDQSNNKPLTVVIDAGHGGTDQGGIALDGSHEKDITLALALKIKELNKSGNINILLTRSADVFQTSKEKAKYVETHGADLFISLHINSTPFNEKDTKSGLEVFVAKDDLPGSTSGKLLASAVIAAFKNNYDLPVLANPQQKENDIVILKASKCPAVLIEAGYLSNGKDLAYLKTDRAVDQFARNVLKAIEAYSGNDVFINNVHTVSNIASTVQPADVKNTDPGLTTKKAMNNDKPIPGTVDHDLYFTGFEKTGASANYPAWIWDENASAAETRPLFIVNGKEAASIKEYKISNGNIGDMRVLTPKTAMATYGEKARNGVIIINTIKESISKGALVIVDDVVFGGITWPSVMAEMDMQAIDSITFWEKDNVVKKYGTKALNGAIAITTKKDNSQEPEQ